MGKIQERKGLIHVPKSSGSYKKHHGFNSTQIKDGKVVKLRKNGTVKAILGTLKEIKEKK